jgi:type VI secretion system secreted protein Hcp
LNRGGWQERGGKSTSWRYFACNLSKNSEWYSAKNYVAFGIKSFLSPKKSHMNKQLKIYCSIGLLASLLSSYYVSAQTEEPVIAYVTVQGSRQGQLKGSAMGPGRQGQIECIGFTYSVQSPRDANSGLPTGKIERMPVTIVKYLDGASPQLLQAAYANEDLKTVTIEFTRKGMDGRMAVFQTIRLTNATISKLSQFGGVSSPDKLIPNNLPMEEISFTYQKIEIDNTESKTSATDNWNAR